jgi:deazaflavin-dependent oxidoreductase (nitroreductase family)
VEEQMDEQIQPNLQQRLDRLSQVANQEFCYLTTFGRTTGRPHEIEIWFAAAGGELYVLSGGRDASDWVQNIVANPEVSVRIGDQTFAGMARIVTSATEEEDQARRLLAGKYEHWEPDEPLSDWARTSLPVAVDLTP